MVNCAACNKTIRGNQLMKCTKCDYQYHPLCVNMSEYRKITEITRSTWICPQCRCATPKIDNTNKPIRSPVVQWWLNHPLWQQTHVSYLCWLRK
ncbi:unnamed protein product [Parnassius mnemosyne]|uniref:PHD-type domain-containing protein n=1 Tax=Parnassius mnemosyne TaxID=213953 RepID=A0AAV1LML6_9NEOP